MADEPQPRYAAGSRAGRAPEERPATPEVVRSPATEPVIDIRPPAWFAAASKVVAVLLVLLGVVAATAGFRTGDPVSALVSLSGGALLAVLAWDASTRSAVTEGDELVLRQWFRTVRARRADIDEFDAVRASFLRWDIVLVPDDGDLLRLWVTRTLSAGRRTRQGWLADLEAWRTWVEPDCTVG
ncbi:hypothetical protein KSP35_00325 [Aquihabitans sp. G128]|uniref:hypothetical protein n=1 Tax=Aquihabitans sp. G128 TaxID=2849779 RepID=UPI001C239165|nr:hypothetical protein [Aquihabitans sp. G128]QXC61338.1 hypothetical protein KSP35_00325 [Aquihabitans sp. G128]